MKVNCAYCGLEIERATNQINRNKNNFCNRDCYALWLSKNVIGEKHYNYNKIKTTCSWCGKEITKRPSRIKEFENLFCDRKCQGQWQSKYSIGINAKNYNSKKVTCSYCGKLLLRPPCEIEKYKHLFCNAICKNKWRSENLIGEKAPSWKGGISCEPYCSAWLDKEFKEDIKKRDNHKCQNPDCWETSDRLTIHHIDFIKKNCHPDNLITLCNSCNSRANTNRDWHTAYYQALMHRNDKINNKLLGAIAQPN